LEIKNKATFEHLIAEALRQDFSGWDFSYLDGRWFDGKPPWDYGRIVFERSRQVESLLDMGTGGGEVMSTLAPFPPKTFATESYAPNVPVAQKRLEPLGCRVVALQSDDALPFDDDYFDLVTNRHESFSPHELRRILKPGGRFITQQVGGQHNIRLNELLQEETHYQESYWTLDYAIHQFEQAGLRIMDQKEAFPDLSFGDIGAIVYYLKIIPWQIADFSVERYYERLAALHNTIQEAGRLVVQSHYFYIAAQK
jgi:SAM-dependent methyltransferase